MVDHKGCIGMRKRCCVGQGRYGDVCVMGQGGCVKEAVHVGDDNWGGVD